MSKKAKESENQKLENAKISLAEMMESLRPFLPKREIYEPEPSKEWRIAEECITPSKGSPELQEADV